MISFDDEETRTASIIHTHLQVHNSRKSVLAPSHDFQSWRLQEEAEVEQEQTKSNRWETEEEMTTQDPHIDRSKTSSWDPILSLCTRYPNLL